MKFAFCALLGCAMIYGAGMIAVPQMACAGVFLILAAHWLQCAGPAMILNVVATVRNGKRVTR